MTLKRMQTGQLIESSGFIYIRFYRDGKRVAEKLCQVDDKHYSPKARTVKMLQAQFMAIVNAPAVPASEVTVPEFYEAVFLPYKVQTQTLLHPRVRETVGRLAKDPLQGPDLRGL
jgi:hypothetical protein